MSYAIPQTLTLAEIAESAMRELVSLRNWGGSSYINLPLLYPSGTPVTVRLDFVTGGVRVSDNGFAYREIDSFGAGASFPRTTAKAVEQHGLEFDRRRIFVDVGIDQIVRAICDVAIASWAVADKICERAAAEHEAEIEEHLHERLANVFADHKIEEATKVVGASTSEWEVSAVIRLPQQTAIFQAVRNHANAIYRTSAAFHDIAALDDAPALVSVVPQKAALGTKLAILSQAGRVIEANQPDEVYLRAIA